MKHLFLLCILGLVSGCVAEYSSPYGDREHGWHHDSYEHNSRYDSRDDEEHHRDDR